MSEYYILDGKNLVKPASQDEWTTFFRSQRRFIAKTETNSHSVSTVFLGLDHQFGDGPPLVFETMAFPKKGDAGEECERYSTYDEAVAGHEAMVKQCWSDERHL